MESFADLEATSAAFRTFEFTMVGKWIQLLKEITLLIGGFIKGIGEELPVL